MRPSVILRRALLIGLAAAFVCLIVRLKFGAGGWDLAWALRGAALLADGQNPYTASGYPYNLPLFYPLPTLLILLPLSRMDASVASVLFVGTSVAVLAWAILHRRPQAWPIFLAAPFWIAVVWAQWAPLVSAAVLVPSLLPIAICKPNLGLPLFLMRRPSRGVVGAYIAILLVSLVILPSWPLDWLRDTHQHDSAPPLLSLPGALLPLALLAWRDKRARLLLGLALMPQRFYDVLILWTIPETARGALLLSILSWLVCGPWLLFDAFTPLAQPPQFAVVGLLYLPALVMVVGGAGRTSWRGVAKTRNIRADVRCFAPISVLRLAQAIARSRHSRAAVRAGSGSRHPYRAD